MQITSLVLDLNVTALKGFLVTSWLCPGWYSLRIKVLRCCQSPCEVLLSQGSSLAVIRSRPSAASESPGKGLIKENFYSVSASVRCPFEKAKPVFTLRILWCPLDCLL